MEKILLFIPGYNCEKQIIRAVSYTHLMGLSIEQLFIKRVIDIIGSAIGIVITLPFFVIIGICIKLTDGGPVIYKQTRLTKDGRRCV